MKSEYLIKTEAQLREIYDAPVDRALKKQKEQLDDPSIEFIHQSPFLCLSSLDPNNSADCSPKGDLPGFVKILSKKLISIPDRKGNNRLDSLVNIVQQTKVGILFFVPGRDETLRVNGRGFLSIDPEILKLHIYRETVPKVAILVEIDECYLHCPKALIRSNLWERGQEKQDLKSYISASRKQLGQDLSKEQVEELAAEYKESLKERLY